MPSLRGRQRRCVKLPDLYWSADSPLDGIARAVWAQCLILARPEACARDSARDSHAPCHALGERDSHALERWPAAPLVDESLRSLTLADIARSVQLDRHLVARSLQQLERLGEVARKHCGTWVVVRHGLTQESPATERKRRQRDRRRRDIERDSHAPTTRDSHAVERDSHALARAQLRSKKREDLRDLDAAASALTDTTRTREPAVEAQVWLNAILMECATIPAPTALGSKWEGAYRWIGQQHRLERERVGETLRAGLRAGHLTGRLITPVHVMSYWPGYVAGSLPTAPHLAVVATSAAELERDAAERARNSAELERDAANLPDWLREATT